MRTDNQNPWAGLASYQDPEISELKLKFCGRDDDSYDVAKLIMGNVFVTLYGKSGIGKTSLLNAGVFPELREESFTPLSLRLGMRDEVHPQSYQTMITDAIEHLVKHMETFDVVAEQTDQKSVDFLWNFFARHRFYDNNDYQTAPVIVFDQFEEVFRSNRKEAETLLRQIDYINDKDHTLDKCEVDGRPYRYEQNYRFVVSIREDDFYRLEDSIDNCYLPALKRCRYRLRSLSEEGARDAILIPGEGLFKTEEQEGIVNTIIQIARNKDDQSISTNLLSLVCSRIFVDFQKSTAEHISPAIVETFIKGNPFERFYNEATRGFSNREKSYIEDHLVDSSGRRNSIPESDFLLHVKNGAKLLEGNSRILQRINTSSDAGNSRIELIHDSFCEPLALLQEKRRKKRFRKRLLLLLTVLCIILGSVAISGYMLYTNHALELRNGLIQQSLHITKEQKKFLQKQKDEMSLLNESLNRQIKINEIQKDSLNEQLGINEKQKKELEQSLSEQQKLSQSLNEKKRELEDTIIVIRKQSEKIERMNHKLEKSLYEIKTMNIPIGSTARYMEKGRPESILSNILSDILVWGGKSFNENPDFAVYIIGCIRAPLKEGQTTYWDITEIAPFDNKICFLTLTGAKVMELFEQIASRKGEGVSHGVKLTISDDGRLLSAYLNGERIDPNRKYRIATLDYAALGMELPAFQDGTNVFSPQEPNDIRFIFVNYWLAQAAQGKAVDGQIEGRIVIKNNVQVLSH
jgi:hypothetical protein